MACFLVPAGEAAIVTIVSKTIEHHYKKSGKYNPESGYTSKFAKVVQKRKWLTNLLWGGCTLLALEHVWHGEIVPFYPFLTAAYSAESTQMMLEEMMKVGVGMSLFITFVWIIMIAVSIMIETRSRSVKGEAVK